ncbi:MAG: hypothetical protein KGQ37_03670 [Hyphomicrobiales bacterium]|nr:hypothetical protein [Hyphomicrobiales bacterium]
MIWLLFAVAFGVTQARDGEPVRNMVPYTLTVATIQIALTYLDEFRQPAPWGWHYGWLETGELWVLYLIINGTVCSLSFLLARKIFSLMAR